MKGLCHQRNSYVFLMLDRNQPQVLWLPFQTAAGTITSLYKGKKLDFLKTYDYLTQKQISSSMSSTTTAAFT